MSIGVRKDVQVDARVLAEHLEAYSLAMGLGMAEVIRKQSGLFCLDLIKHTMPFTSVGQGGTSASKTKGMDNIEAQVRKVFVPLAYATADEIGSLGRKEVFLKWEKARGEQFGDSPKKKVRWETFQQNHSKGRVIPFVENSSDLKPIHRRMRKDGGKGGLQNYAKSSKSAFAIVKNEKTVKDFIKEKQRHVGMLKSGYYFAAQQIKSNVKTPPWTRQSEGAQYAIAIDQSKQSKMPAITVGNWIGRKAIPWSLVRSALNSRGLAMRAEMAYKLERDCKQLWIACAQGRVANPKQFFT